jgi:hypothetical protein
MHDNAIHDLALAYRSVLLSLIKRAALLPTGICSGKNFAIFASSCGKVIVQRMLATRERIEHKSEARLSCCQSIEL